MDREILLRIQGSLDEILSDVDTRAELYQIETDLAEREVKDYANFKDMAVLGNEKIRSSLIKKYASLLSSKSFDFQDEALNSIINFKDILKNEVYVLFEMLISIYDISEIIEKYKLGIADDAKITEDDIRSVVMKEKENIKNYFDNRNNKYVLIATIIYAIEYGQACIDTIQHHNINEIGFRGKDYIYIGYKRKKIWLEFLKLESNSVCENIQKNTTARAKPTFDKGVPFVTTSKENSSRITVAGYSIVPENYHLYNERIFNLKKISLEELKDRYSTLNDLIYKMLCLHQKCKGNSLITGNDSELGKSTLLNALIEKVPNGWGVGIIDAPNELRAHEKYSGNNIYTLVPGPLITIQQCFDLFLKMNRDVLAVGEISIPDEVSQLINCGLRLNCGVLGTMHSSSPFTVIQNLRNLMMRTEMYNNASIAEEDAARCVDLIIHLGAVSGRIFVESIVEVEILHREEINDIKVIKDGTRKEMVNNILYLKQLALLKQLQPRNYKYREILRFDIKQNDWILVNNPSEEYYKKMVRYARKDELDMLKASFNKYHIRLDKNEV